MPTTPASSNPASRTIGLYGCLPATRLRLLTSLQGQGWRVIELTESSAKNDSSPIQPDLIITEFTRADLNLAEFSARCRAPVLLLNGNRPELSELLAAAGKAASASCAAFDSFKGKSAQADEIRTLMTRIAASDCNVLITGETGTGKELVAELIHRNSGRSGGPFVCVNCAALPEHLVESELFGHERGAFTGAHARTDGKLQLADGGTIFFDEIGDMSSQAQAKLLRAIEARSIYRVGGHQSIPLNIRILAATNRDLDVLSRTGAFRSDLFYRLNVARIDVPALRERRADIRTLLAHYVRWFNQTLARDVSGFSELVLTSLTEYDWPGNVRELRNFVESTFVYSTAREFSWADVPPHFRSTILRDTPALESERDRIVNVLVTTEWNRSLAARRLHLSRMTLYRKMSKYGITRPA